MTQTMAQNLSGKVVGHGIPKLCGETRARLEFRDTYYDTTWSSQQYVYKKVLYDAKFTLRMYFNRNLCL